MLKVVDKRELAREKILSMCQKVSFFNSMSKDEIENVLSGAKLKKFRRGEVIIREGDVSSDIFYIVQGEVKVVKYSEKSKSVIPLAKLGPNRVFGEVATILHEPRTATIISNCDTTIILSFKVDITNRATNPTALSSFLVNLTKELCVKIENSNKL
jgi:CRP-like cAMP-binding protein